MFLIQFYKFVLFLKSITKLVKHCNKNDEIKACVVELETFEGKLNKEIGTWVLYGLSLNIYLFGKLYNTIQYNTIQYNTIQYHTIHYNTIQYNTKSLQTGIRKEACWTYPNPFPK